MNETAPNTDRFRIFFLVLTLVNTIFAALLSGLHVDANIRADKANNESQYYALLAAHELVRLGYQTDYDLKLFANTINNAQQSTVLQLTALELEQAGEEESATRLLSHADAAQARSDEATALSMLYSDARYAPTEPDGLPDREAYLTDQSKMSNDLVEKQNRASDAYHKWDNKADTYITVLSILALAFFLLGLAQSTDHMRLFFGISALVVMALAAAWTGFIMIS